MGNWGKGEKEREGEQRNEKKRGEIEGKRENAQRGKQLSFPLIYFRHK